MTLTISIIAKDGIILASDSRATIGNPLGLTTVNDTVKKVFKVTNHSGLAIAGEGELGATLIDAFYYTLHEKPNYNLLSIDELVDLLRSIVIGKYNEWFPHIRPEERPYLSIILSGYRKDEGGGLTIPQMFTLHSSYHFAPCTNTMGFAALGITPLATYLLNRLYTKDIIKLKAAIELASFCIVETASQDGKVGGNLQLATFSNIDDFNLLGNEDVNVIIDKCSEFRKNLQNPFYAIGEKVEIAQTGPLFKEQPIEEKKL